MCTNIMLNVHDIVFHTNYHCMKSSKVDNSVFSCVEAKEKGTVPISS